MRIYRSVYRRIYGRASRVSIGGFTVARLVGSYPTFWIEFSWIYCTVYGGCCTQILNFTGDFQSPFICVFITSCVLHEVNVTHIDGD